MTRAHMRRHAWVAGTGPLLQTYLLVLTASSEKRRLCHVNSWGKQAARLVSHSPICITCLALTIITPSTCDTPHVQAVALGKQAARLVSQGWFSQPMELKYERVYCPFLLLHVNRYAGTALPSPCPSC